MSHEGSRYVMTVTIDELNLLVRRYKTGSGSNWKKCAEHFKYPASLVEAGHHLAAFRTAWQAVNNTSLAPHVFYQAEKGKAAAAAAAAVAEAAEEEGEAAPAVGADETDASEGEEGDGRGEPEEATKDLAAGYTGAAE